LRSLRSWPDQNLRPDQSWPATHCIGGRSSSCSEGRGGSTTGSAGGRQGVKSTSPPFGSGPGALTESKVTGQHFLTRSNPGRAAPTSSPSPRSSRWTSARRSTSPTTPSSTSRPAWWRSSSPTASQGLRLSFKRVQNRLGSHRRGKTRAGGNPGSPLAQRRVRGGAAIPSDALGLTGWA
jgi:hypothetical protein